MITPAIAVALFALGWSDPTSEKPVQVEPHPPVQEARPETVSPLDGPKGMVFLGQVVDGLGRPVSGVTVTVEYERQGGESDSETVALTGDDGRYSATLAPMEKEEYDFEYITVVFNKEGYGKNFLENVDPGHLETVALNRKIRWGDATDLPYCDGDDLDQGLREVLASEEWEWGEWELLALLFKHQDHFRPAFHRLIDDVHVGEDARYWLEFLGDPRDRDLFPKGRRFAPKEEVREADLVEAIKAAARQRNFFSSSDEPRIDIDSIVFTEAMDRVIIQCGINRAALTGITWKFVFVRVNHQWVLRSVEEAGRS